MQTLAVVASDPALRSVTTQSLFSLTVGRLQPKEGAMIACPACQTSNPDSAQFCASCGTNLASGAAPGAQPGVAYAGFWIRFAAWFIDGLILLVPTVIISVAVGPFAA